MIDLVRHLFFYDLLPYLIVIVLETSRLLALPEYAFTGSFGSFRLSAYPIGQVHQFIFDILAVILIQLRESFVAQSLQLNEHPLFLGGSTLFRFFDDFFSFRWPIGNLNNFLTFLLWCRNKSFSIVGNCGLFIFWCSWCLHGLCERCEWGDIDAGGWINRVKWVEIVELLGEGQIGCGRRREERHWWLRVLGRNRHLKVKT